MTRVSLGAFFSLPLRVAPGAWPGFLLPPIQCPSSSCGPHTQSHSPHLPPAALLSTVLFSVPAPVIPYVPPVQTFIYLGPARPDLLWAVLCLACPLCVSARLCDCQVCSPPGSLPRTGLLVQCPLTTTPLADRPPSPCTTQCLAAPKASASPSSPPLATRGACPPPLCRPHAACISLRRPTLRALVRTRRQPAMTTHTPSLPPFPLPASHQRQGRPLPHPPSRLQNCPQVSVACRGPPCPLAVLGGGSEGGCGLGLPLHRTLNLLQRLQQRPQSMSLPPHACLPAWPWCVHGGRDVR